MIVVGETFFVVPLNFLVMVGAFLVVEVTATPFLVVATLFFVVEATMFAFFVVIADFLVVLEGFLVVEATTRFDFLVVVVLRVTFCVAAVGDPFFVEACRATLR